MPALASDGECPDLIVTLVHGTYPRGVVRQLWRNVRAAVDRVRGFTQDEDERWSSHHSGQPYWFDAGSAFEKALIDGMRGPCRVAMLRYCWSGVNSFAEREAAATRLATRLAQTAAQFPNIPHVVVAHSHGGTVAARALGAHRAGSGTPVTSLVTLGTPFIRLSPDPAADADVSAMGLVHFIAALLPPMLLVLAPLGAIAYGLRTDGSLSMSIAVLAAVISLVAVIHRRVRTAALVVTGLALIGSNEVRSDMFALAFAALVLGLPLSRRVVDAGFAHVDWRPLSLDVPLLALQGARDEAARAIGLGQLAASVAQLLARGVVATLAPLGRLWSRLGGLAESDERTWRRALGHVRGIGAAVLMGWAVFALVVAVRVLAGVPLGIDASGPVWLTIVIWAVLAGAGGLLVILMVALALLLAWTLPTLVLSLVAGPEVFLLPVITQVDAEPLPWAVRSDGTPADMRLEILYDARVHGLAHSVHEAAALRARVAAHLDAIVEQSGRWASETDASGPRTS